MIKISDSFKTDDKKLAALYESARSALVGAIKPFGAYNLAVISSESDKMTLASEIMSAETYARYDVATSMECVRVIEMTQREDGQLACEIIKNQDEIYGNYWGLSGFCFVEEALSLFYMTKKKEKEYLDLIYRMFSKFDDYIWGTHDYNKNGLPELISEKETVEGAVSARYAPLTVKEDGKVREISLFPIETGLMAAFAYRLKMALCEISLLVKDGRAEIYYDEAQRLRENIKANLWVEENSACFDRDYRGSIINSLSLDNLFMMYYGALDKDMADAFVKNHLLDPEEFYTNLPLPNFPIKSPEFSNDAHHRYGGQVRGVTYRRAIRALEKYGYYTLLTDVSKRFIDAVSDSMAFTEQYDPFTGAPSREKICADYAPTASAILEIIARFYGVSVVFDDVVWGALGHEGECSSEYNFKWGGDTYTLSAEKLTSTGSINGSLLFTITNGARVITDWFGDNPRVVNIADKTFDCVFVYRNQTFSFTIEPGEIKEF